LLFNHGTQVPKEIGRIRQSLNIHRRILKEVVERLSMVPRNVAPRRSLEGHCLHSRLCKVQTEASGTDGVPLFAESCTLGQVVGTQASAGQLVQLGNVEHSC